jgi:hypothetical protein
MPKASPVINSNDKAPATPKPTVHNRTRKAQWRGGAVLEEEEADGSVLGMV